MLRTTIIKVWSGHCCSVPGGGDSVIKGPGEQSSCIDGEVGAATAEKSPVDRVSASCAMAQLQNKTTTSTSRYPKERATKLPDGKLKGSKVDVMR